MKMHGFVVRFSPFVGTPTAEPPVRIVRSRESILAGPSYRIFSRPFPVVPEVDEQQPILRGPVTLVYKGRVDNRDAIAARLSKPHLATAPDGEALVEAYLSWGDSFLEGVVGELSFAIIDARARKLLCGRDHLGVGRCFYFQDRTGIWVSSNLDLLLGALPELPPVGITEIAEYLLCHGFPLKRTLYSGILQVPAGHQLDYGDTGESKVTRHWRPERLKPDLAMPQEACDEAVRGLLFEGVQKSLRASTAVGLELSGGLDSSTVASVAGVLARDHPGLLPDLFTLSFAYSSFGSNDESSRQDDVLKRYPFRAHRIDASRFIRFSEVELDAPFHASYEMFERALLRERERAILSEGGRIVVSGHGGDSVFHAGMPPFYLGELLRAGELRRWVEEMRPWLRGQRHNAWQLVWDYGVASRPDWLRKMFRGAEADWCTPEIRAAMDRLTRESFFWPEGDEPRVSVSAYVEHLSFGRRRGLTERSYEYRHPLMYRPLVELIMTVPWRLRLVPGSDRVLCRRAFDGILPESVRTLPRKTSWGESLFKGLRDNWPTIRRLCSGGNLVRLGVARKDELARSLGAWRHGGGQDTVMTPAMALEIWLGKADRLTAVRELTRVRFHEDA